MHGRLISVIRRLNSVLVLFRTDRSKISTRLEPPLYSQWNPGSTKVRTTLLSQMPLYPSVRCAEQSVRMSEEMPVQIRLTLPATEAGHQISVCVSPRTNRVAQTPPSSTPSLPRFELEPSEVSTPSTPDRYRAATPIPRFEFVSAPIGEVPTSPTRAAPSTRVLPASSARAAPSTHEVPVSSARAAPSAREVPASPTRAAPSAREVPASSVRAAPSTRQVPASPARPAPASPVRQRTSRLHSPPSTPKSIAESIASSFTLDDPFDVIPPYVPVHRRSHITPGGHVMQYSVPESIISRFPPDRNSVGWKMIKWYVVYRGREIGVFYDFWFVLNRNFVSNIHKNVPRGNILPLVSGIRHSWSQAASSGATAVERFNREEQRGTTRVLSD